jgi:hypothetical protein
MIGLLVPQTLSVIFSNPSFGAFSEGVARAAEHEGYALQFISPLHGSLTRAVDRGGHSDTAAGAALAIIVLGAVAAAAPPAAIIAKPRVPGLVPSQPSNDWPDSTDAQEGVARVEHLHLLTACIDQPRARRPSPTASADVGWRLPAAAGERLGTGETVWSSPVHDRGRMARCAA